MWMNVKEVAKYCRRSVKTIYRLIKIEKIPCYKKGKMYIFNKDEIDNWLRNNDD